MSKGLEALKDLKNMTIFWNVEDINDLSIIEKELKEYEMEHTLRVRLENINYELVREKQENEKKLKALEIIKNKEINIHALLLHLKRFDSPEGYNVLVGDKYKIIQEEYDLLKEVLL